MRTYSKSNESTSAINVGNIWVKSNESKYPSRKYPKPRNDIYINDNMAIPHNMSDMPCLLFTL